MNQCKHCGNKFSRSDNLKRHQIICKVKNKPETVMGTGVKRQYGANDDRSVFEGENTIPVNNDKNERRLLIVSLRRMEVLVLAKYKLNSLSRNLTIMEQYQLYFLRNESKINTITRLLIPRFLLW